MTYPVAVLTDALEHMSFADVLVWCSARGITGVELGAGAYSAAPHIVVADLLGSADARRELSANLDGAGVELVALNVSGNPLHPNPEIAAAHEGALRDAVVLAAELGVRRVVAMSGCPGGLGACGNGSWPVFAGGAWLPDMEGLWDVQFEQLIGPFWSGLSGWAVSAAPDVRICLELHPGTSIYNAESFAQLAQVTEENIAVNLDPSHFWWQGIDPIATIERVGPRIGFVHGKDTKLHPDRIAVHGVLDFRWPADVSEMPWHFCAVGRGRTSQEWATLLAALADAGYRGPVSIEHEDPELDPESGVESSLAGLRDAMGLLVASPDAATAPGQITG
jgi:sugar phosphate isomerase/epimerase